MPGQAVVLLVVTLTWTLSVESHSVTDSQLVWFPCTIDGGGLIPPPAPQPTVQCTNQSMPLFWDQPTSNSSDTIYVWVQRVLADPAARIGSLWFLYGGPGTATTQGVVSQYIALYYGLGSSYDMYFMDYRGVGRSTDLGNRNCLSNGLPDSRACAIAANNDYGSRLHGFTTTNTARDILWFIRATSKQQSDRVMVLGVSWGTFVANRLLQLPGADAVLNGVILDGVCTPGACMALNLDRHSDSVAKYLMTYYCGGAAGGDDSIWCRNQFSNSDPLSVMSAVFQNLTAGGGCAEILFQSGLAVPKFTRAELSTLLFQFIGMVGARNFVPAVIFRMNRCNENDQRALAHMIMLFRSTAQTGGSSAPPVPPGLSFVHQYNIEYSELWYGLRGEVPIPTAGDVSRLQSELFVYNALGPLNTGLEIPGYSLWPKYSVDSYTGNFANSSVPLLLLNGDLDIAAPVWNALRSALEYENSIGASRHRIVVIPYAAHTTIGQSPVLDPTQPFGCGANLIIQFLLSPPNQPPNQSLNLSCLSDVIPLDFRGITPASQLLANQTFGTTSLWDAIPPPPLPPTPYPEPATSSNPNTITWSGVAIGFVGGALIAGAIAFWFIRYRIANTSVNGSEYNAQT